MRLAVMMRKAKGPLEHVQRVDDRIDARPVVVARLLLDQVGQDLAVGGRLEEAALVLEVLAQQVRIDDVAVVRQGEVTRIVAEEERLHVLDAAASGRRVAHVADGHAAAERRELRLVEHLGHQTAPLDAAQPAVVTHGHDAGPLLPAVLQRMQAVVGQRSGIGHAVDAEHAALLVQLPVVDLLHLLHHSTAFFNRARISL